MALAQPAGASDLAGLPPGTTLLELGRWLLSQPPDVATRLAVEGGPAMLSTFEQAVALATRAANVASYLREPARWVTDFVSFPRGKSMAPYQGEAMDELAKYHRLALRGPHGLGKTAFVSWTILWFALTRDMAGIQWKVPTLASVGRQLEHFLWPEIHLWAGRLRWDKLGREPFTANELLRLRLRLSYGEAWAQAATDPSKIEGAHATHLLYVYEEAKAIPDPMWDASEGAFSGAGEDTDSEAWALATSTPGRKAGRFYKIHRRERGYEDWRARHVKLAEAVAAGQVSADWALARARQWRPSSALFQNRVLGNFADESANVVIPLEWVEAAIDRWWDLALNQVDLGPVISSGLDLARGGEDESVLALSCQDTVLECVRPNEGTSPEMAGRVRLELAKFPGRPAIVVDADGLGAGYFDAIAGHIDWTDRTHPFHASAAANWRDYTGELRFGNARAAAWWALREELDPNRPGPAPTLALPPDDLLIGDLTEPIWREQNGRIYIEEKEKLRKRLGRSTDTADAVVMARWGVRLGLIGLVTAESHRIILGPDLGLGDLRRGGDAAGPGRGGWNPQKVGF